MITPELKEYIDQQVKAVCDNIYGIVNTIIETQQIESSTKKDDKKPKLMSVRGFKMGGKSAQIVVMATSKDEAILQAHNFISMHRPEILTSFDNGDKTFRQLDNQLELQRIITKSKGNYEGYPLLIGDIKIGGVSQKCISLPKELLDFRKKYQPDIPFNEDDLCKVKKYLQ